MSNISKSDNLETIKEKISKMNQIEFDAVYKQLMSEQDVMLVY